MEILRWNDNGTFDMKLGGEVYRGCRIECIDMGSCSTGAIVETKVQINYGNFAQGDSGEQDNVLP